MKTIHPAIAEHVMEENEKLREVLRCIADLPMDRCSTENDYRLSAAKAIALGALSQQAEPAPAQDEREATAVPEGWLIELGFDVLDRPFRFVDSKSHTPTIKVILPACEPDDSSSWDLRDEIARRIGSALATRPAQTEQQPVGWINEDELPENYPYDAMFPFSRVDVVRMFPVYTPVAQTAPQPEQSGLVDLLRRVTNELEDLNSAWLEQADDCGDPDGEREFCDATQELIDEARSALSAQGESHE